MKLKLIPPGEFMMGHPGSDSRLVKITRPFNLSIHEVTVGQFRKFIQASNYRTERERDGMGAGYNATTRSFEQNSQYSWKDTGWQQEDNHPVVNVTWNDAVAFCRWLSRKEGTTCRLPTEAEWECACRAGTTTLNCSGNDNSRLGDYAWFSNNSGTKVIDMDAFLQKDKDGNPAHAKEYQTTLQANGCRPHSVCGKQPNAWGLYDMHGNVWEWCEDWFAPYGSEDILSDPVGPASGELRVYRGASFYDNWGTSAWRSGYHPTSSNYNFGFRVARTYDLSPAAKPTAAKPPAEKTVGSKPPPPAIAPFDATQARQHQQAWAVHLGTPVETTNSVGMKLKLIPAGEFRMGSPDSDGDAKDDEKPQHLVKVTKPFYLSVYEVTQQQYEKVVGTRPWQDKGFVREGPDYPATYVSHDDAVAFCRKLSKQESVEYRLPTEAEWEYACRAGTTTVYSFGDDASRLGQNAWCRMNTWDVGKQYAHRVGQKPPNSWGLYDMHGNVWEWCQDWFGIYPSGSVSDPQGRKSGSIPVSRGGSFWTHAAELRLARRSGNYLAYRNYNYGFRVARTYDLSPAAKPPAEKLPAEKTVGSKPPPPAIAPFDATQARQHQQVWAGQLGTPVETTNSIGMKLKLIPAGEFRMGSPNSDRDADSDEKPQHLVKITQPFYLGVYEVTQGQYEKVMGTRPWQGKLYVQNGRDDYPASFVSWNDAVAFCRKLSKQEGVEYRLPTEAEWEYVCRAGTTTTYSIGNDASRLGQYAWYRENAWDVDKKYAHRVGQKLPHPWGLHEMHGNVWEWCQDWKGDYPSGSVSDPQGQKSGSQRVLRGGSFHDAASYLRSAYRSYNYPARSPSHGFRAART
jgi:formylglycine-generating enzyme required for sulfatase activity